MPRGRPRKIERQPEADEAMEQPEERAPEWPCDARTKTPDGIWPCDRRGFRDRSWEAPKSSD